VLAESAACGRGGGRSRFGRGCGFRLNIFDGGFEVVDDVAVFGVGDFGDAEFDGGVFRGKPSGVVNLAAAGGIEGGAVENERGRGFRGLNGLGVEVVEE